MPSSSLLLVAAVLLLPQTDAKATSYGSVTATLDLYSVRGSSICALLGNTGALYSEAWFGGTPDPWPVFGNAEVLPLSECRHPHDFAYVDAGSYVFLSNLTEEIILDARNYTFTFCVNAERAVLRFSCYRVHGQNGETYFVAPADYHRVLIRGPVGYHECPRAFEGLLDNQRPLFENEHECATFLTVSSYGVRADNGECVRLARYALFKDYPEVWNGCQRYAEAGYGNAFYDCQFGPNSEPWNYPTQNEVTHCADRVRRVACSAVFDMKADARFFYPGRGKGEMTQNKFDKERCQELSTDGNNGFWYYRPKVAIGAGGIIVGLVVLFALRIVRFLSRCDARCCEPASVSCCSFCDGGNPCFLSSSGADVAAAAPAPAPAQPNNAQAVCG